MKKVHGQWFVIILIILSLSVTGCASNKATKDTQANTITVTDQLGRSVTVPKNVERFTGTHHFGGQVAFGLGQQAKLVDQAVYGQLGEALKKADKDYAAKPMVLKGKTFNMEEMISLKPQVAFVYATTDKDMIPQFENAGIKAIAVSGETLDEAYASIRLMAKVLNCEDKGEAYIAECNSLLKLVSDRIGSVPQDQRPRVLFAGPQNAYTVASGDMMDTNLLELAGGVSVSKDIKGFWTEVSPEQVTTWNPDVIVLGSSQGKYGSAEVLANQHFQTVKAVKDKKVFIMPSNIGWWDFPAPNCVIGVVWLAKSFYPEKFSDVDMTKLADDFYSKVFGYSFTALGGKLE